MSVTALLVGDRAEDVAASREIAGSEVEVPSSTRLATTDIETPEVSNLRSMCNVM